eukprot:1382437-Rhodomonas_salina.2
MIASDKEYAVVQDSSSVKGMHGAMSWLLQWRARKHQAELILESSTLLCTCLLYTSDAADDM